LLRLLRHRFTIIPETVVQRIETTTDPKQLEAWVDIALTATELVEFDHLTA